MEKLKSFEIRLIAGNNLAAANSNGFSDPTANLQLGNQKRKSKTCPKTVNPTWDQTFSFDLSEETAHVLGIEITSSDLFNTTFLGQVFIDLNSIDFDGDLIWFPLLPRKNPKPKDLTPTGKLCATFVSSSGSSKAAKQKEARDLQSRLTNYVAESECDLSGLDLSVVPDEAFTKAGKWETIDLGFNKFIKFPDVGKWTLLTSLDLTGNQINNLEPNFVTLPATLQQLHLNGNQLTSIPDSIERLAKIEKLSLANNKITYITKNIGKLKKLEDLLLNGNPLKEVQKMIGACSALEVLDLSATGITDLPGELTYCSKLLELNLGSNNLTELPEGIGRMSRLTLLNVADNQLTDLPLSIGMCQGLGRLGAGINVSRNPLKDQIIFEKFAIGPDHLIDYLEKRLTFVGEPTLPIYDKASLGLTSQNKNNNNSNNNNQNTPSKPLLTTPPPSTAPSQDQKILALKRWANTTIQSELRVSLRELFNKLDTLKDPGSVVKLAQVVKLYQPEMEKAKQKLPSFEIPKSKVTVGSKIDLLKGVIEASLDELSLTLKGIQKVLNDSDSENDVVSMVQLVKAFKQVHEASKNFK